MGRKNKKLKFWKYAQTPGIKVIILDQLGEIKRVIFNIMFDNVFWDNIV